MVKMHLSPYTPHFHYDQEWHHHAQENAIHVEYKAIEAWTAQQEAQQKYHHKKADRKQYVASASDGAIGTK
jgi:hypothetical protein